MEPIKRSLSRSPQCVFWLVVLALAGGCGTEPPVPASIAISPDSATLLWFDETIRLTATVQDLDGRTISGVTIKWTSGDESVVTVDAAGLVKVVGKGMASVRAEVEELEALSTVTVDLQRGALVKIYEALGGPGWFENRNWGTDEPIHSWSGVTTDTVGNVVGLHLGQNELTGRIPVEMVVLETLEHLNLTENDLTGPIPPELGRLETLRVLALERNALTGPIPPELGNLTKLYYLRLDGNALTGPIPPELGNLHNLFSLSLSGNALTGPIPPELGNLAGLSYLTLSENALTGPIPPALGNLGRLRRLALDYNELTGPVPPEFGDLQSLEFLAIDNTTLSGRLPRELIGIRPLQRFYWYETGLCSPPDEEFQEWLASIRGRRGNGKCAS